MSTKDRGNKKVIVIPALIIILLGTVLGLYYIVTQMGKVEIDGENTAIALSEAVTEQETEPETKEVEYISDTEVPESEKQEVITSEDIVIEEESREIPGIDLMMVGDMLMHLRVTQSGKMEDGTYNYDHLFKNVKRDIQEADLAIVNQEVIIGGNQIEYSGYPLFNTAYELADSIEAAGFDVVLHATNHTMDKGRFGLMNCINYWKNTYPQMAVLGIHESDNEDIYVYEQDGIRLAILNYTYGLNGMPKPDDMPFAVDVLDEEKVREDITRANEVSDFVMVCPHWGTEYQITASTEQKRWAQIFLEEGVDLVIGTHPHVIEPVEWLEDEAGNKMLVYYSLGNFVNSTASEGSGVARRVVGAEALVTIQKNDEGEAYISSYGVEPLVTQVIPGSGKITTYHLSEYTQELAQTNEIRRRDSAFSLEYCKDLCREVFGDLYEE